MYKQSLRVRVHVGSSFSFKVHYLSVPNLQAVNELHHLYPELELGALGQFLHGRGDGLEERSVLVFLLLYEVGEDGHDVLLAVLLAGAVLELGPLGRTHGGLRVAALLDVHEHLLQPVVRVVVVCVVVVGYPLLDEALLALPVPRQVDGVQELHLLGVQVRPPHARLARLHVRVSDVVPLPCDYITCDGYVLIRHHSNTIFIITI